jgi:hypothetical protein
MNAMYLKSGLRKSDLLMCSMLVLLFAPTLTVSSATIVKDKYEGVKAVSRVLVNEWDDFYRYANRSVRYPVAAQKIQLQGTTMIKFSIVNGLAENIAVVAELGGGCDAAVMKCISTYAGYKGIDDGDYTLKFKFVLSETSTVLKNEDIEPLKGYKSLAGITINGYGGLPKAAIDGSLNSDPRVFDFVALESRPSFAGGMDELQTYIKKNISHPKMDGRNKISKVFLSFIVEVDGSITNVKVVRGLGAGADEEAVRLLRESPKWIPGVKDGKVVRVMFNTTVDFNLK